MKHFVTANITRTAVFVVLLSVLPAMAIIAATGVQRYTNEIAATEARGERFVRLIAARQTQLTEVMETLAETLVRLRDIRGADTLKASRLFHDLVQHSPEYENIILLDNTGAVVASALPSSADINFSGYAFFKRALRRGAFCVGKVAESPFSKKPVLFFAIPAAREDGEKPGVIAVSLNLARYLETLSGLPLADSAAVLLLDGTGTLAASYPGEGPVPVGDLLGTGLWRGVQKTDADAGSFFSGDMDGSGRLYVSYRKLFMSGMDQPYFYILYLRPESSVYAQAKALLQRDIVIYGLAAFFSLAATLGLCAYAVRRPWRALLAAATGVGGGDLSTRVDTKGVGGEIGLLCGEFNAMAEALDKRDKELTAARDYAELSRNAKSEFLANMSHEIRTSMNAILGMAYLVLKTELTPQQKGYVSKLLAAANTLLRVINDILDFSKMEAGKLTMESIGFSLRRIVSNVRSETASRLGEKQLLFTLQTAPDVPDYLIGDPLRLSQALMVLVDDAINRSERGTVSFTCSVKERDQNKVTLQFVVHDAGVGLTPVQLAEMRDLFSASEDDVPATMDKQSLRLAIANRLLRMMGGHIEVNSVFGEGARFTAVAGMGYAAGELREAVRLFEGRKALIVDSSEVSRQDLVEILSRFGFQVECAADLDTARNLLARGEEAGAPFTVVFADWRGGAPDMPAQIKQLKEEPGLASPPPVILTTAVGRAELPPSIAGLDIDALLPKPINESLVFDTLMNILGVQREETGAQAFEHASMAAQLAGVRVLLVEDNIVNQQIAGEILESEGILLTVADNGEDAVTMVTKETPGTFDMVLMDLQMPKMDGFEATRALRSRREFPPLRLPIIAMTAHTDVQEISACYAAGMNDYTGKPIIIEKLFATLRRWLPAEGARVKEIAGAVKEIRNLVSEADPPSLAALEDLLSQLAPLLHEGRMGIIRQTLMDGDFQAISDMLEALEGMARDLLGPEDAV